MSLPTNPYVRRLVYRSMRKKEFLTRCSNQGKLAKAKLILSDKGKNGKSMNDGMLRAHGFQREGEPTP